MKDLLLLRIFQAESWLKEQAQAQGWAKATRLEGRPTKQGLVAVLVDSAGRNGSMVEVRGSLL